MSTRELVVLGTASQAPTRQRNHNGYLLRWDGEAILFDPGEGTQRQLLLAGVSPWSIRKICITHFHGDHCLGLPGVLQRLSLDGVPHPVDVAFPESGTPYYERLRHASVFQDRVDVRPCPVRSDGVVIDGPAFALSAVRRDPELLHEALREAELLVELATSTQAPLAGQEETYRLLIGVLLRDPAELARLRARTISPLSEYDAKHDTDLLATLEAFLTHHGSTTETAEAMRLHRHTVGYRLARVHEVSGLSPYETDGRERLGLGLKAAHILEAEERRVRA